MSVDKEYCQVCGTGVMNLKRGRLGHFMGCSKFPECKNTYAPDFAKLTNKAIQDVIYKREHRKAISNTFNG